MATHLQPKNIMDPNLRPTVPSLTQLANEVPRINNYDMQALADQWREIAWETFPEQYRSPQCQVEDFYKYVLTIMDTMGKPKYECLAHFAFEILALPTSNTDVERLFSKFSQIKRKERSNLKLETITSLIHLNEYAKMNNMKPYKDMISVV